MSFQRLRLLSVRDHIWCCRTKKERLSFPLYLQDGKQNHVSFPEFQNGSARQFTHGKKKYYRLGTVHTSHSNPHFCLSCVGLASILLSLHEVYLPHLAGISIKEPGIGCFKLHQIGDLRHFDFLTFEQSPLTFKYGNHFILTLPSYIHTQLLLRKWFWISSHLYRYQNIGF